MRIKHRAGRNTVKLYDKQGSVLRVETTLNEVKGLKSYRAAADTPGGPRQWRPMRKGVAEMPRRAEVSQVSRDRYLEALGGLPTDVPPSRALAKLCHAVVVEGRRYRALNPLGADDARLLGAVGRGEWLVAGFRNRDIRRALYGEAADGSVRRRQAGRVTRLLGLLRAHGLIKRVPRTHRYLLTVEGTSVIPALVAVNNATLQQLNPAARSAQADDRIMDNNVGRSDCAPSRNPLRNRPQSMRPALPYSANNQPVQPSEGSSRRIRSDFDGRSPPPLRGGIIRIVAPIAGRGPGRS